jgi:hypothetical protein
MHHPKFDLPLSDADRARLVKEAHSSLPRHINSNWWRVSKSLFKQNVLALAFMLFLHWLIGAPLISPLMIWLPIVSVAMLPYIIGEVDKAASRSYNSGLKFAMCLQAFTMHLNSKRKTCGPVSASEAREIAEQVDQFMTQVLADEQAAPAAVDPEYIQCGNCGQRLGTVDQRCPICKAMPNDTNTRTAGSGSISDGDRVLDQGSCETACADSRP